MDTTPRDLWQQVEENLRVGRLRLMLVADVIPETLKRIIEFPNEQMTAARGARPRDPPVACRRAPGACASSHRPDESGATRRPANLTFDELVAAFSDAVRTVESRLTDHAIRTAGSSPPPP